MTRALAKPKELKFFLAPPNGVVREDERSSSPYETYPQNKNHNNSSFIELPLVEAKMEIKL